MRSIHHRLMLALAALTIGLAAAAQNQITVKEVTHDPNDATAQTLAPKGHKDKNNERCALLVVHNVDLGGFTFNTGGYVNASETTVKSSGEKVYTVWVSPGTKWIVIGNRDTSVKPSERWYFTDTPLESDKTYHMTLGSVVKLRAGVKQYVTLTSSVPGIRIAVEEEPGSGDYNTWVLDNGRASKALPFGTYNVRATAPDYQDDFFPIEVTDKDVTKDITLKPNFGTLTIRPTDNLAGARIIIDGELAGTGSLTDYRLKAGTHTLEIDRPKYKHYRKDITMAPSQQLTEAPVLEENFSRITIESADPEADIYLLEGSREVREARGTWMSDLEPGEYVILTRRAGHKDGMKQITVKPGNQKQTFSVPAPEATYGVIDVTSNPSGASIYLDGQYMGTTPKMLNDVLATAHKLRFTYPGYQDYETMTSVAPNQTATVSAPLSNIVHFTINTIPQYASIYVDGRSANNPYVYEGTPTKKEIEVSAYRRKPWKKTVEMNRDGGITVGLPRQMLHGKQWYIQAELGFGSVPMGVGVSTGFDLGWFNFEAGVDYRFTGTKDFYLVRPTEGGYANNQCTLHPSVAAGARVGFNIDCGTRFRVTPQVGITYTAASIDEGGFNNGGGEVFEGDAYSTCLSVGVRCFLPITYNFGVALTPEYLISVMQNEGMKFLRSIDGSFNKYATGFNCRLGVVLNF